ncbi:unnamed protein product [Sympodiomycopsis kandeliae]
MAGGFFSRRSRLSTILLVILGLFLLGTVAVLSTAKAYFSIDKSAYVLPEELGTWEEISWGAPENSQLSWAAKKYPWLHKLLHPHASSAALAEAQQAAEAALAAGAAVDPSASLPPLRDNSPKPADPNSPPEKIPRIIHQTWKSETLPPKWDAVRQECAEIHPDYEYMLWTDAASRAFIAEHYPWFLSVFDSYPYNIQRADAIRYFVLHHYGGIYMDLDIGCNRRLDPLLRFEIVLPVTRPVGVSNDLIFAEKGHPFMDQLIHNLATFNHRYLTHYPTVMFSTGPMFVSASYGLYVEAHGPAYPSTPSQPDAGFKGVRVLPKSLYGKNAKPAEVPDAFFKHYYGSSWHAGDAGFLIFLRDHGRFLMFLGACVVAYGFCKTLLPKALFTWRKRSAGVRSSSSSSSRRRSRGGFADGTSSRGGQWVSLPFQTTTTTEHLPPGSRHSKRRHGISRSFSQTPDTRLDMELTAFEQANPSGSSSRPKSSRSKSSVNAVTSTAAFDDNKHTQASASSSRATPVAVAAPKPQRATLPFFQLEEEDELDEFDAEGRSHSSSSPNTSTDEPRGLLGTWSAAASAAAGGLASSTQSGESPPGTSSGSQSEYGGNDGRGSRWRQATNGVLLLPAYALSRMSSPGAFGFGSGRSGQDVESDDLSPSESQSSIGSDGVASGKHAGSAVVGWAAQMLPSGWRGPVNGDTRTPANEDEDEEDERSRLTGRRSSQRRRSGLHVSNDPSVEAEEGRSSLDSGKKTSRKDGRSRWLDTETDTEVRKGGHQTTLRPTCVTPSADLPYLGEEEQPQPASKDSSSTPPPPPYGEK